ncbi:uncharacterized protein N7479_004507 [Penicillium vulpinum]|uniref:uncharacterized protein n=1 Tax=Penicillium vulpinum TaxID=29845 RepID=UPI002547DE92|nr:uncharacterized protein N7479_004507 [Penicillium vulpinum]KAJ5964631.1 hypothetical protein N7479_004507 [Penicillium vulpinum]
MNFPCRQPAYKWYLTQSKRTAKGAWTDIIRNTTFGDTNKLKHYINKKYIVTGTDTIARSAGGSPSLALLREIRFEQIYTGETEHRPILPLKRNSEVNTTEMRVKLREIGYTGAYILYKADSASKACCTYTRQYKCDYFEYFSDNKPEEDIEEGSSYSGDSDTAE